MTFARDLLLHRDIHNIDYQLELKFSSFVSDQKNRK